MSLTEINIREKEFHNKLQSKASGRFENIFYKSLYNINEDFFSYIKEKANQSQILDFGCGTGLSIEKTIKYNPKRIVGIDISEVSIEKAKKKAKEMGINVDYYVDNCEKTKFENNSFDIIYGAGILHHLEFNKCLDEIHRILKSNGNLIFIEPLGTNPIINLYRKLTPSSRSLDEHPLVSKDFKYVQDKFKDINIKYYGFLTLIFFPFYRSPNESKLFKFLANLDQILFKFKIFRILAWSVLITAKKN
ncbi:class I SAM-dependent methyltransferase [Candidatus Pelagibacter bacterium]|nr:class I SAM-dependent methyltransferase [Candidatus Pelagibacter bacterium]|tara:strand:- start:530 stop:1273 length:744 start_codon:yes stop_codon:yes gene_type:complete